MLLSPASEASSFEVSLASEVLLLRRVEARRGLRAGVFFVSALASAWGSASASVSAAAASAASCAASRFRRAAEVTHQEGRDVVTHADHDFTAAAARTVGGPALTTAVARIAATGAATRSAAAAASGFGFLHRSLLAGGFGLGGCLFRKRAFDPVYRLLHQFFDLGEILLVRRNAQRDGLAGAPGAAVRPIRWT